MARKTKQRISYVLPLANHSSGHRLGVNGLAVDTNASILYSGGRDGVICSWDLGLPLAQQAKDISDGHTKAADQLNYARDEQLKSGQTAVATVKATAATPASKLQKQVQAHTHWINDIKLVQNNEALVSASSDMTIKVWRASNVDTYDKVSSTSTRSHPQTIGLHDDYVKCLASPNWSDGNNGNGNWDWIASGGLDHKIRVWDLHGAGQKLQISIGEEEGAIAAKGSVYALAATPSILASGGPESIVRVWDTRTGKRIRNFVGHTDNIRHILAARDGDAFVTASSDRTVKIWSMTAGRCMHTFTMHSDSVWSLYSDHPHLALFYSSDRSGLVAKTDSRKCVDFDQGICVAVCQENQGVSKIVAAGNYLWTGTSSSSINRWEDVNTRDAEIQLHESYRAQRASVTSIRSKRQSIPVKSIQPSFANESRTQIPIQCLLKLSNTAPFPFRQQQKDLDTATVYSSVGRKASEAILDTEPNSNIPYRSLPEMTIEGQNGLIKHILLNDRRRVLTLDTAGEVMLWDLMQCVPIRSFGKRHMDEIMPEIKTVESVAHWCSVDTRTGSLTCVLDSDHCFDAEIYMDELYCEEDIEIREDQRINLGKWILRYLFANFIDEEVKRDMIYREKYLANKGLRLQRSNAPAGISIPKSTPDGWQDIPERQTSPTTPRASKHHQWSITTPGLGIGIATPGPPSNNATLMTQKLSPPAEDIESKETFLHSPSPRQSVSERNNDYFTVNGEHQSNNISSNTNDEGLPTDNGEETNPRSPSEATEKDTQGKEGSALFGKKLRMPFGMKKISKVTSTDPKNAKSEEKIEDSDSKSSQTDERITEDSLFGVVQRIRFEYEDRLQDEAQGLESGITPSPQTDTPLLNLPENTVILIQEERPEHGGVADLFEGTVGSSGQYASLVEKVAPMWLGDVLLKNVTPIKENIKVYFILEPYQGTLPSISDSGDNRLNASRMLRARKILQYVAEKIESNSNSDGEVALRPEDYLELYCQNQLVPPLMTLATIRSHLWRGGGDVILYYRANGRKPISGASDLPSPPQSTFDQPNSGNV